MIQSGRDDNLLFLTLSQKSHSKNILDHISRVHFKFKIAKNSLKKMLSGRISKGVNCQSGTLFTFFSHIFVIVTKDLFTWRWRYHVNVRNQIKIRNDMDRRGYPT